MIRSVTLHNYYLDIYIKKKEKIEQIIEELNSDSEELSNLYGVDTPLKIDKPNR